MPAASAPYIDDHSVPPGLRPGAIIAGKYRIDGLLGSGGMGLVFSATHLELRAPVAIKVVRDTFARNELIMAQFIFEARAAARMRSAHVIRILDVGRLGSGAPYIVMEQLQGADLATVLYERGMLPISEAIGYVLQACEGLAETHALGVVHRDLKPENLFLADTPEGPVLKILDFGVAKEVGPARRDGNRPTLSREGASVGSPFYMAPEQMRAAPNLDARADIWSLGAILFELVTGHCPFEAETLPGLAAMVLADPAPTLLGLLPGAPAELDAIIQRCLSKAPERRFQTVTELSQAVRDFATRYERQSIPDIDIEIEVEEPLARPPSSRTGLAWFGVGALLVAAGLTLWQVRDLAFAPPAAYKPTPYRPAAYKPAERIQVSAPPSPNVVQVSVPPRVTPAPAVGVPAPQAVRPKPPPGGWKWPPEAKLTPAEPARLTEEAAAPTESTSARYGL